MKPERIEELTKENRAIAASGVRMTHQPIPLEEALHLLRCARAVAELGEWLRAGRDESCLSASLLSTSGFGATHFRIEHTDGTIAHGPDLLTAVEAALARAKDGGA